MAHTAPIQLLFDRPAADVGAALERFLGSNDQISANSVAGINSARIKLSFGALGLVAALVEPALDVADYQTIFASFDPKRMQSAIELDLAPALAAGNRVPPIAKAFLQATALLAIGLDARAVAFGPAKLLCDAVYFDETVQAYAEGAAFPALATIGFIPSADGQSFTTQGLDWFAGQEIEFNGHGLPPPEMMRRLVRIVHDICTNGPILQTQTLSDIDPAKILRLEPMSDGSRLVTNVQIGAKSSLV